MTSVSCGEGGQRLEGELEDTRFDDEHVKDKNKVTPNLEGEMTTENKTWRDNLRVETEEEHMRFTMFHEVVKVKVQESVGRRSDCSPFGD